jgi:predicted aspartyl protease
MRLALVSLALLQTACDSPPRAYQASVAPGLMKQLESRSVTPEELNWNSADGRLSVPVRWNAPELVTTKLSLREGVPTVKVTVNGHERDFIIDTGSETGVMEADMALACGLRTLATGSGRLTARGATGAEPVIIGLPDRMEIGGWNWSCIPCLVRTMRSEMEGPGQRRHRVALNLIGIDVMRRMCAWVTLDFPRGQAQFGFRGSFQPSSPKVWNTPLAFNDRLPHVLVGEGGNRWAAMVDTGASTVAEINSSQARTLGLDARAQMISVARVGLGSGDSATEYGRLPIESLEGLGPKLVHAEALLVPDRSKIGSGLLQKFRVTIDFKRNRLWLEDPA